MQWPSPGAWTADQETGNGKNLSSMRFQNTAAVTPSAHFVETAHFAFQSFDFCVSEDSDRGGENGEYD